MGKRQITPWLAAGMNVKLGFGSGNPYNCSLLLFFNLYGFALERLA
jgi:hypothetical protein